MMNNRFQGITRIVLWTVGLAFLSLPVQAQELALGSSMPGEGVSLQAMNGEAAALSSFAGSTGTVVVFWSNQCPWIEKYNDRFAKLVNDFSERGIRFVLVNSNDGGAYPQESLDKSAGVADGFGSAVTYLADGNSELARAFAAERTPHVYLFNGAGKLVYVGTIDDSPGDPNNVTSGYLRDALEAVAAGRDVPVAKTKAFGCTIKFKS